MSELRDLIENWAYENCDMNQADLNSLETLIQAREAAAVAAYSPLFEAVKSGGQWN